MEFLILGGIILVLDTLKNIEGMKQSLSTLSSLKTPIGFVLLLKGFSLLLYPHLLFQSIMCIIGGAILMVEIIILAIKDTETKNKVHQSLLGLSIPVGFLTLIAGIIGLFLKQW